MKTEYQQKAVDSYLKTKKKEVSNRLSDNIWRHLDTAIIIMVVLSAIILIVRALFVLITNN